MGGEGEEVMYGGRPRHAVGPPQPRAPRVGWDGVWRGSGIVSGMNWKWVVLRVFFLAPCSYRLHLPPLCPPLPSPTPLPRAHVLHGPSSWPPCWPPPRALPPSSCPRPPPHRCPPPYPPPAADPPRRRRAGPGSQAARKARLGMRIEGEDQGGGSRERVEGEGGGVRFSVVE